MHRILLIVCFVAALTGRAQNRESPYSSIREQSVDVRVVNAARRFDITQTFHFRETPSDSLRMDWDVPAWRDRNSHLARELINEQEIDLRYAESAQLGYCEYISIGDSLIDLWRDDAESIAIAPEQSLTLQYPFGPPSREFNGEGRDEHYFGMNHPFIKLRHSENAASPANLRGYGYEYPVPSSLTLHNPERLYTVLPDHPGVRTDTLIESFQITAQPLFFLADQLYDLPLSDEQGHQIHIIYRDNIPPVSPDQTVKRLVGYIENIYGNLWPEELNVVVLDHVGALRSHPGLLFVEYSANDAVFESKIIESFIQSIYSGKLFFSELEQIWMIDGMAHFHRYDFLKENFPDERLIGEFADSRLARFLDVDDLKPTYFHRWLYLYMVRQGLDQPLSDPSLDFAPLNIEAVVKGKSALGLNTLRGYAGQDAYRRGMRRLIETQSGTPTTPEDFLAAVQYFANKDLSWFLGDFYHTTKTVDYDLSDFDQCSYLSVVRVENHGELAIPFSTVGYDENNRPVLEEWHEGHLGKKDIQLHLEEYIRVEIDPDQITPDLDGQDHMRRPGGLFQATEPIHLQFYTGLDQPDKTQIYWLPTLKFNAYDGVLAGVNFYNKTLLPKRWEYKAGPEYSTRTGTITGTAALRYFHPLQSDVLHAVEAGLYGRYFHYDEGLSYTRFSPGVNLHFRKSHPRSTVQPTLKLRAIAVDRELREEDRLLPPEVTNARYWVFDVRYILEDQNILHPSLLEADAQMSERFSRVSVSFRQRYMLPNRQWLGLRLFAGSFLYNQQPEDQPFFSFGLSGTQDYLFDYNFIGRSDSAGIWSRQFFVSDGGFKTATDVYSGSWMTSASLNVPVWKGFGFFGDLGYVSGRQDLLWDYGIRLAVVPDFLEVYFPIQSNRQNHITAPGYSSQIRFILNLNQEDIIQRLRRGWY